MSSSESIIIKWSWLKMDSVLLPINVFFVSLVLRWQFDPTTGWGLLVAVWNTSGGHYSFYYKWFE